MKDDPEALAMFREAMKCQHGGDRKSEQIKRNNVTLDPVVDATTGNSRDYSIDRVKRECDEETVAAVMAGTVCNVCGSGKGDLRA